MFSVNNSPTLLTAVHDEQNLSVEKGEKIIKWFNDTTKRGYEAEFRCSVAMTPVSVLPDSY